VYEATATFFFAIKVGRSTGFGFSAAAMDFSIFASITGGSAPFADATRV